jgi:uncharacterized protein involved in type VI secretion and phage assembly
MVNEVTASFSQLDVKLGGNTLSGDMEMALAEIEIENTLHLPDSFTLRFHLSSLDDKLLDIPDDVMNNYLAQGTAVVVSEKDNGNTNVIMDGEITSVALEFSSVVPSGQIYAVVQGYDHSHRLHRGRKTKSFIQNSYSDIASKVIQDAGLLARVDATSGVHDYVVQSNQTDWEFLWQLAHRVGYQVYADGDEVHFKKPQEDRGVTVELNWGVDISQFRSRSSLAFQDSTVTVRGWDAKEKRAIVGKAETGTGGPNIQDSRSGAQQAKSAFNESSLLVADKPVDTQADAEAMAQSVVDALTGTFIQAEGVTDHGMSSIVPGVKLNINGIGKRSGEYYVTATTHRYSGHEGYTTSFVVGGPRSHTLTDYLDGGSGKSGLSRVQGVVVGLVSNNNDPDGLSRVKLQFPWLDETLESDWVRIAFPGAGAERGMYWLPEVQDEVLVAFEHGDIHRPYVLGGLWNGQDKPPDGSNSSAVGGDGKVNLRSIRSREGLGIIISDESGKKSIEMTDGDGDNKITIQSDDKVIEIDSNGAIKITGAQGKITVEGQDIEIKSSSNLTLDASANLDISAGANLTMKGGANTSVEAGIQMAIKGTATTTLEASGMTEIKGAMVKIN